ncbi:MAG: ZIP family metal transporter [Acidobacteriia bacterium]|nr:ZIP family metal transporter [Terriglobia bacterium]
MLAATLLIHGLAIAALATGVGVGASALGIWLAATGRQSSRFRRLLLPFSAGLLLGVALFGLLPELALEAGWKWSLSLFGLGYLALAAFDRYVYPVCPTCSHGHDHSSCMESLHGFAQPLVTAAAIHSFLDGWSVATAQSAHVGLRVTIPLAVALHKIPEGLALGGVLRAAIHSRPAALGWCVLAEGATLVGGALGLALAPQLGTAWILYPLGVASGWIFYLGCHAVHEEWRTRGAAPVFVSILTGLAGAAVIQRGAEALFR